MLDGVLVHESKAVLKLLNYNRLFYRQCKKIFLYTDNIGRHLLIRFLSNFDRLREFRLQTHQVNFSYYLVRNKSELQLFTKPVSS